MLRSISLAIITAAGGLVFAAPSFASDWKIDASHSNAGFSIRHMMISNVRGEFQKVSGTAEYDGKNINTLKVTANIDPASIDTANADRDKHLRGADFFNVEKYPEMKFVSKKVLKPKKDSFKLVGDLTMHGVTKEVTLDVDGPTPAIKDPRGNTKIGASASATINRKDWGINYGAIMDNGGAMLGDEVKITLDVELAEQKSDGDKKVDATDAKDSRDGKSSKDGKAKKAREQKAEAK